MNDYVVYQEKDLLERRGFSINRTCFKFSIMLKAILVYIFFLNLICISNFLNLKLLSNDHVFRFERWLTRIINYFVSIKFPVGTNIPLQLEYDLHRKLINRICS